MRRGIALVLLLIVSVAIHAEHLNIGIYHKRKIRVFEFQPTDGSYIVFTNEGKLEEIGPRNTLRISVLKDKFSVAKDGEKLGDFRKLNLIAKKSGNGFKVECSSPSYKPRYYVDNLFIKVHPYYDHLQLVNNIEINNYVAGVVEAEVGRNPPEEYFKLQAIICRTYAIKNKTRHSADGYQLCDGVHCQAYHGRPRSKAIHDAAMSTKGTVIVDSDINLITAAFFSNCGGQTVNSEKVWVMPVDYLRSVHDTFCLHENNSLWERTIPKSQWKAYLVNHGATDLSDSCLYHFDQSSRRQHYDNCGLRIPLKKIRLDFKLKSAYFSVEASGANVVLKGRGFGHGVGLCQEGAMRMARLGLDYPKILHHYYRNVHLVNINNLDFFKQ